MERNHSDNIRCIEKGQPEYPEKLKAYDHMPEKLYIKGRLPDPERPCAAVVGARMCSPYVKNPGVSVCKDAGRSRSADHKRNGNRNRLGRTQRSACRRDAHLGSSGSGPGCLLSGNQRNLYERILREKGGIISEYPPGTQPRNYHFPARNRILSALSDLVL